MPYALFLLACSLKQALLSGNITQQYEAVTGNSVLSRQQIGQNTDGDRTVPLNGGGFVPVPRPSK